MQPENSPVDFFQRILPTKYKKKPTGCPPKNKPYKKGRWVNVAQRFWPESGKESIVIVVSSYNSRTSVCEHFSEIPMIPQMIPKSNRK